MNKSKQTALKLSKFLYPKLTGAVCLLALILFTQNTALTQQTVPNDHGKGTNESVVPVQPQEKLPASWQYCARAYFTGPCHSISAPSRAAHSA